MLTCDNESKEGELQKHVQVYAGQQLVVSCHFCNKIIIQSSYIEKHERRMHTQDLPHKCKNCEVKLVNATAIINHSTDMHGAENPEDCKDCDKICCKAHSKDAIHFHTGDLASRGLLGENEVIKVKVIKKKALIAQLEKKQGNMSQYHDKQARATTASKGLEVELENAQESLGQKEAGCQDAIGEKKLLKKEVVIV